VLVDDGEGTVDDALEVIDLSECTWRVTDRRFEADGRGVLAYLERIDDKIAVSIVYPPPMTDAVADCLASALALISQRSRTSRCA
jgi:hypothetical protein